MDRFTETDAMDFAEREPVDDWNDRDEDCTCHFTGDQADASSCYAHGTIREEAAVAMAPLLPILERAEFLADLGLSADEIRVYTRAVAAPVKEVA